MIKFGPSGNDDLFYEQGNDTTAKVFPWLKNLELNLYEYSFGRGVLLGDETAKTYAELAKNNDIEISVHAPYYVNLANTDDEMVEKSFGYIEKSLKKLILLNGKKCVVHIGSQMKMSRESAISNIEKNLKRFLDTYGNILYDNNIFLCPETMGKYTQIGSYKEIVDLCSIDNNLIPTFDFGHINCVMQGTLKTKEEYRKILDYLIEKLGYEKASKLHIHFSKIEFSSKGEIKHLTLADEKYGPPFEPLAELLSEYKLNDATIICESKGAMARDAQTLKSIFDSTNRK